MKSEPSTLAGVGGGDGLYSVDGQGERVRQETVRDKERRRKRREREGRWKDTQETAHPGYLREGRLEGALLVVLFINICICTYIIYIHT